MMVDHKEFFSAVFFNLAFIALQLIFLTLWISFKNKKWTNIIDTYLGLGDILFFVAISSAFSPIQFVLFYLISIVITLIAFVVYKWKSEKANSEIPLAGAMSVVLIICMLLSITIPQLNFYNTPLFIPVY
jgi:H+/Cl- antiporter ClcA